MECAVAPSCCLGCFADLGKLSVYLHANFTAQTFDNQLPLRCLHCPLIDASPGKHGCLQRRGQGRRHSTFVLTTRRCPAVPLPAK